MRDLVSCLSYDMLIAPAALNADNTPVAVDLRGFDGVAIYLQIGVGGITFDATNKIEFKLTHSDDNSSYTDVASGDIQGVAVGANGIVKSLTEAHGTASTTEIGYRGGKRYLKLLADFSGTHGTATPIAALAVKGHGHRKP